MGERVADHRAVRMVLVAGVPGSGKSHYAEHLQAKGWRWLNHDDVMARQPSDELEQLWVAIFDSSQDLGRVGLFVGRARLEGHPLVIEFGFPVHLPPVVQALHDEGVEVWWFGGDGPACLRAWRLSWQGRQPEGNWLTQVANIATAWPDIAMVFGPNVIVTMRPEGPVPVADIDAAVHN